MKSAAQKLVAAAGLAPALLLCALARPAAAAFADLGAGARGPAMGNAVAAASEDVYSVHYNPAGLGLVSRPQFTAAYTQHLAGLSDGSDLSTSFYGYAHPLENGAKGTLAGALNSFSLDGGLYRENTLYLGYGRRVYTSPEKAELCLGGTLKYLYSSFGTVRETYLATDGVLSAGAPDPLLSGKNSHSALDADVGAVYRFMTHYQAALQVTHLNSPDMAFSSKDSDPLYPAVKAAFNYRSLISNMTLQVENSKAPSGSQDNRVTAAAERWFPRASAGDFAARGALGLGSRGYRQVSLGFSYRNRRMQADYGFSLPLGGIASTNGTHRMALTFRFGKASDQEETLQTLMETLERLKAPPAGEQKPQDQTTAADELARQLTEAEAAVKAGRYRDAVAMTTAIVEKDPAVAAAWQTMGIAYLAMEKYKSSLYAWNKAYQYEKSPALREAIKGYIQSITRLDRTTQRKGKPAEAAPKAALSQTQIDAMLNQGVDSYVKRDFGKAVELFEKVLQADPGNVEAQKALRRLKEEQGRP